VTIPHCDDEWTEYPSNYYEAGWHAITVERTEPNVLGTLYVITTTGERTYSLLDRPPVKFGFG
jgi:hypothetical protein